MRSSATSGASRLSDVDEKLLCKESFLFWEKNNDNFICNTCSAFQIVTKLETSTWRLVKFQAKHDKTNQNDDNDVTRPWRVLRWKYARVISLDSFQARTPMWKFVQHFGPYMEMFTDFQISCLVAMIIITYCHPCPFLRIPPVGVGQRTPQLLFDGGGPGCTIGLRHGRSKGRWKEGT